MKKEIHPAWYPEAKIACACGHVYHVGATVPEMRVEICAHCHPFFTGQEKLIDTERRVEKFEKRRGEAQKAAQTRSQQEAKKKEEEKKAAERPRTLKEMLKGYKT